MGAECSPKYKQVWILFLSYCDEQYLAEEVVEMEQMPAGIHHVPVEVDTEHPLGYQND